MRSLFADQLGGSRVESVDFDSSIPSAPIVKRFKSESVKAGKKRKRDEEIVAEGVVEDEDSALPKIWKGELRKSGGSAVVCFVDKASCRGAWKEVRAAVKEGREIKWEGGGEEGVMGIERKSFRSLS